MANIYNSKITTANLVGGAGSLAGPATRRRVATATVLRETATSTGTDDPLPGSDSPSVELEASSLSSLTMDSSSGAGLEQGVDSRDPSPGLVSLDPSQYSGDERRENDQQVSEGTAVSGDSSESRSEASPRGTAAGADSTTSSGGNQSISHSAETERVEALLHHDVDGIESESRYFDAPQSLNEPESDEENTEGQQVLNGERASATSTPISQASARLTPVERTRIIHRRAAEAKADYMSDATQDSDHSDQSENSMKFHAVRLETETRARTQREVRMQLPEADPEQSDSGGNRPQLRRTDKGKGRATTRDDQNDHDGDHQSRGDADQSEDEDDRRANPQRHIASESELAQIAMDAELAKKIQEEMENMIPKSSHLSFMDKVRDPPKSGRLHSSATVAKMQDQEMTEAPIVRSAIGQVHGMLDTGGVRQAALSGALAVPVRFPHDSGASPSPNRPVKPIIIAAAASGGGSGGDGGGSGGNGDHYPNQDIGGAHMRHPSGLILADVPAVGVCNRRRRRLLPPPPPGGNGNESSSDDYDSGDTEYSDFSIKPGSPGNGGVYFMRKFLEGDALEFYETAIYPYRDIETVEEALKKIFRACFPLDFIAQMRLRFERFEQRDLSVQKFKAKLDDSLGLGLQNPEKSESRRRGHSPSRKSKDLRREDRREKRDEHRSERPSPHRTTETQTEKRVGAMRFDTSDAAVDELITAVDSMRFGSVRFEEPAESHSDRTLEAARLRARIYDSWLLSSLVGGIPYSFDPVSTLRYERFTLEVIEQRDHWTVRDTLTKQSFDTGTTFDSSESVVEWLESCKLQECRWREGAERMATMEFEERLTPGEAMYSLRLWNMSKTEVQLVTRKR
ncbi:hypothetical protein BKA62DRAFT_758058 [Auriculariales sp. MPI-PUGE-AT-0066]|nr:hypothetical protein BKA62DRAFT_758058 [Auriculariales sp. MPI-PUGE-AT-0066]